MSRHLSLATSSRGLRPGSRAPSGQSGFGRRWFSPRCRRRGDRGLVVVRHEEGWQGGWRPKTRDGETLGSVGDGGGAIPLAAMVLGGTLRAVKGTLRDSGAAHGLR